MSRVIRALVVVVLLSSVLRADVKMPAIFSDHMVLQAGAKIPVWGMADPGEKITITLGDTESRTAANDDGSWLATLHPVKSDQPLTMTIKGKNEVKIEDVLIGEVWLGSGQSNMQWTVRASKDFSAEIRTAQYPKIRLFHVPRVASQEPQENVAAKWQVCSPETIPDFSAVAYFFGRHLHQNLNVPVGLIHSSWGGTHAEVWTPREGFNLDPELKKALAVYDRQVANYPKAEQDWKLRLEKWKQEHPDLASATRPSTNPALRPPPPPQGPNHQGMATNLYNAMIHPLRGFPIKGVIWYQGESNAGRAAQYRVLLTSLINSWRKAWASSRNENPAAGEFAFYIVQLANFNNNKKEPSTRPAELDSSWALIREAQADVAHELPNSGMAVTIDIGEGNNIHPKNKQDVGKRLGLIAEKQVYGRDVIAAGPTYKTANFTDDHVTVEFDNVGDGLKVKGDKLIGFAIAGDDRNWEYADAKIVGNTVMLTSEKVKKPTRARYAWADNPEGVNLYNSADLPAAPFRTDRELK